MEYREIDYDIENEARTGSFESPFILPDTCILSKSMKNAIDASGDAEADIFFISVIEDEGISYALPQKFSPTAEYEFISLCPELYESFPEGKLEDLQVEEIQTESLASSLLKKIVDRFLAGSGDFELRVGDLLTAEVEPSVDVDPELVSAARKLDALMDKHLDDMSFGRDSAIGEDSDEGDEYGGEHERFDC